MDNHVPVDKVAEQRTEFVVTKGGVPVARVVPMETPRSTEGSVTILVDDEELLFCTGEVWDAEI